MSKKLFWKMSKKSLIILLSTVSAVVATGSAILIKETVENNNTYTLTLTSETPERGDLLAEKSDAKKGESIAIEAQPFYGYTFEGWYDEEKLVDVEAKTSYVMPAKDKDLQAVFGLEDFFVSVSSKTDGFDNTVSQAIPYLTEYTLQANDIDGMAFVGWYCEDRLLSQESEYTIVIEKDVEIVAEYFEIIPLELISLPTAEEAIPGQTLAEIKLSGGSMSVPGSFAWTDDTLEVVGGQEYFVTFSPFISAYSPTKFLIVVPQSEIVLETPKPSLSDGILSWNAVETAQGYTISINDTEIEVDAATTQYSLPTEMGEYYIAIQANGDEEFTVDSPYSGSLRYVPTSAKVEELGFGSATSEYEDGELKKFGGTFTMKEVTYSPGIEYEHQDDWYRFKVNVDIAKHLKEKTKLEVLTLNGVENRDLTLEADVSIVLGLEVVLSGVEFYGEFDLDFPTIIEDLAFGLSYNTLTTTIVDININGEFVDPGNRRSTLNLIFLELVGLEEPLYKWIELDIPVPGLEGLAQVELSVGFDILGAVAASLYLKSVESSDYYAGLQLIKNGVAVFAPYYEKEFIEASYLVELAGELDFSINVIRLSATLQLKELSLVRLNVDLLNLDSDLSGEVSVSTSVNTDGDLDVKTEAGAKLEGAYRLYGQITFEYYLELRSKFFLPLDDFKIKILDGSLILAEWELAKGGLPKTSYRDEAASYITPIFATDGEIDYYKGLNNAFIETDTDFSDGRRAGFLGNEEIVDIDNNYVYVFGSGKLRRVGRTAGTERTVVLGIERIVGSDRNFIYYTFKEDPNKIRKYYRSDYESQESLLVSLPKDWKAIRMRYDYSLNCYVIYAEKNGTGAYFTYNGTTLSQHGKNEHRYWDKKAYDNGAIAYYSLDKNNEITECFIRYPNGGVVHENNVYSIGISEQGIFIVKKLEGGVLPYEIGLYKLQDSKPVYVFLSEVADENAARRVSYYNGYGYYTDLSENKIRIFRTDGDTAEVIATKNFNYLKESKEKFYSEVHESWLFVYSYQSGTAKTLMALDLNTLRQATYIEDGTNREFDKGNPTDISFTLTEEASLIGFYLSEHSEEELKSYSDAYEKLQKYADVQEKINKLSEKFLGVELVDVKEAKDVLDKTSSLYCYMMDHVSASIDDSKLVITISAESLGEHEYGLYHGYLITTKGIFIVYVKIVDTRSPYIVEEPLTFDKNNPSLMTAKLYAYDDKFTVDLPKGSYASFYQGNGLYNIYILPEYLMQLPYGENTVYLRVKEGGKISFKIDVTDSRSPSDSTYHKTFDKSYSKDITFTFALRDEQYVASVSGNGIPSHGAFHVNAEAGTLTFAEEYLQSLFLGNYTFEVTTSETTFTVTVCVIETVAPTADTNASFDLASNNDFEINFIPNDAYYYNVFLDDTPLMQGQDYTYTPSIKKLILFNSYLQNNVETGEHILTIRTIISSGDETKSKELKISLTIDDSRTPTIDTEDIHYEITKTNTPILIRVKTYGKELTSVAAETGKELPFVFEQRINEDEIDLRGGYIKLLPIAFIDVLEEGAHKLSVKVGAVTQTINLYLTDNRLPEAIETKYWYDEALPATPVFTLRFYGEEFVSVSGNGITESDYEIIELLNQDAHVLRIHKDFIQSIYVEEQDFTFVVMSNINQFTIVVHCYTTREEQAPQDPEEPEEPEIPVEKPTPPADKTETPEESIYVPTYSYSTPQFLSTELTWDMSNPQALDFVVDYGYNNEFGSLRYGKYTLLVGEHYTLTETGFTIHSEYLQKMPYGKISLYLYAMHGGEKAVCQVNIMDSRVPERVNEDAYVFDRYDGGSFDIAANLYDSKVQSVTIAGHTYNEGFGSNNNGIRIEPTILRTLDLGEQFLTVSFNDCEETISVTVTITDIGLYFESVIKVDKAQYTTEDKELFIPWTLYQGEITNFVGGALNLVSYSTSGVLLNSISELNYGSHSYWVVANEHTFQGEVILYDSRTPHTLEEKYVFDKATYEYTLDPIKAKDYDLAVEICLYDKSIRDLDISINQTIEGHDLEYSDYRKLGNVYYLSYLYLYRLRVGTYTYTVKTTGGKVNVVVEISDSRTPVLFDANPVVYDYEMEGDQRVTMQLYGETVSSVSRVDLTTGEKVVLTEAEYAFDVNSDGDDVLVIKRGLLETFFMGYDYQFEVVTTTERTLIFTLQLKNGPKKPYTVVFYSVPWDRGEPSVEVPNAQTVYEGDCIEKPEDPMHEYFDFLGWYSERTGGSKINFEAPITSDQNVFMRWQPKKYTITVISQGEIKNTLSVSYLSPIPTIEDPVYEGYVFVKWTIDEAHTIRFAQMGKPMPHESFTIYAEWIINEYLVRFVDGNGLLLKEETVLAYENATPPSNEEMVREHYEFKGWSGSYTSILYDRTLTAQYTPVQYAITYHLNGGSNSNLNVKKYTIEDDVRFVAPTKSGYEFLGWYTTEDFSGEPINYIPFGSFGEVTVYAKWQVNTYSLHLESNYPLTPAIDNNILQITYDTEYTLPIVEVPKGMAFLGWFEKPNGTGAKYTEWDGVGLTVWKIAHNTTFYAHIVEVITFENIRIEDGSVAFSVKHNLTKATVTLCTIEFLQGGTVLETLAESLAFGENAFVGIEPCLEYEIRLTFEYDLGDGTGIHTAVRSFFVCEEERKELEIYSGQTVLEIKLKRETFESVSVNQVTVMDMDGNIISNANVYGLDDYVNSFVQTKADWVYVTGLTANTRYQIEIQYSYTLFNYAGTYTASFVCEGETVGILSDLPEPVIKISAERAWTRNDNYHSYSYDYYKYTFYAEIANTCIENNLIIVGWELWAASSEIPKASGDFNTSVKASGRLMCNTLNENSLTNAKYKYVLIYSYELQDGNGTIVQSVEYVFDAVIQVRNEHPGCVVNGTKVLMADGSEKNIEDVRIGELIQVWNFETGSVDVAAVMMRHTVWQEEGIFTLRFSDGSSVGVGREHGFFCKEDGQFVVISAENAKDFIGKHLAREQSGIIQWFEVVAVDYQQKGGYVSALITQKAYNHFAGGYLSVVQFVEFVNYFNFNLDAMAYDQEKKATDIERYGEYSYEVWADYLTYEQYCYLNGRYMSVLIGKGLLSFEDIVAIIKANFPILEQA